MTATESGRIHQSCSELDSVSPGVLGPDDDTVASGADGHAARRPRRSALARRLEILAHDPYRRPNWRWVLAGELVGNQRRVPRSQDSMLAVAVAYRRALEGDFTPAKRAHRWPALVRAHELHLQGGRLRTLVQARLLAGQTPTEIAGMYGLEPDTVAAFEDLFFDVRRDRLAGTDYIVRHALGDAAGDEAPARDDLAQALRAFGFFGGSAVLDVLEATITTRDELLPNVGLDELQTRIGRLKVRARLAVAAFVMPFTPLLARELLRIKELVAQIEHQYDSSWSTNHQNSDLTDPLVAALPGLWSGLLATKPVGASLAANDEHAAGKAAQEASSKDAA